MKWITTDAAMPAVADMSLLVSGLVLCQDRIGHTFLGYVRYCELGEFDPVWTQAGRDMYNLDDIIRWIPLRDILSEIS